MKTGTARIASTVALALTLTALTIQAPAALAAAVATPVATTTTVSSQQPLIGAALTDTQNTGVLGWIATSMTQMPALSMAPLFAPGGLMEQHPPTTAPVRPAAPSPRPTSQALTRSTAHVVPAATAVPLHVPAYSPIGSMAAPSLDGASLGMLAAKFLIVLVLLLLCLRILRAVMPRFQQGAQGKPSAMVLHSESIGDKQRVCLLDLQVKLALVSISGSGVTPITTIEDSEKIAALREYYRPRQGKVRSAAQSSGAATGPSFDSLLQEMQSAQPQPEWNPAPLPEMVRATADRRGARPQAAPRFAAPAQEGDPLVGQALMAIRGLRRKVEQR